MVGSAACFSRSKRTNTRLALFGQDAFRFPHCAAPRAHLAAGELAKHAYVVQDRNKSEKPSSQIGLALDRYHELERQIVEEACWLAENWKAEDHKGYLVLCQS